MRILRPLLLGFLMLLISSASFAQIGISVSFGPPALPVYEQPICPGDGYLWAPGYWAWDPGIGDYYWVPGTWVQAPEVGYLWTPAWWGWGGGGYLFHEGYWGPRVGFYGGISYGYGYFGRGYEGGRWDGGHFFYNRAVNNVNVTVIHNTYNTTINNTTINHVSYNGGNGGITARPTSEEAAAEHERHLPPVAAQTQHVQTARSNPQLRASANQGRPPIAATARPAEFKGAGVVTSREAGAPYHALPAHASELQPHSAPAPTQGANPRAVDQRYQQQQAQLIERQNQQHQQLQQRQEADHQRATQQPANEARQQQMEQRHQQQTMQLEQHHTEQQQRFEQRAPQPSRPEGRPR